jgi:hypothetical protein
MIIVKEKFSLLKDTPNILHLSSSSINSLLPEDYSEINKKLAATLKLAESRINHFTKDRVFKIVNNTTIRDRFFRILNYDDYPLPLSYNKTTDQIVINLSYFKVPDITYIDPKDVYALCVYGICFYNLVTNKKTIKEDYANIICNFFLSMFVRVFGKEFGLLGAYSKEIGKLKFLISCYILSSFFGVKSNLYKKAHSWSSYDYRPDEEKLNTFDFSDILSFIDSLSKMDVFPGINRSRFSSKFLTFLGLNFIPALEDLSRFMSIITISSFVGVSIVPTHIRVAYNKNEFDNILNISKGIF